MHACYTDVLSAQAGMQEGKHLFMHRAQTSTSMQEHTVFTLCTGDIILILSTLLKLLNDSKAPLNTPQQSVAPF